MKREELEALRRLTLFGDVSDERLERLARGAMGISFPRGAELFEQGETPDFLHVLVEGSVQLVGETADGRETVVEVVRPVDCFILAAALTGTPYLMTARTLETSRVLLLPADHLRAQLVEDPQLALTMLATQAQQFRAMVRNIKNLKLRTTAQRLGCYLVTEAADAGTEFRLPMDKKLLASRLGMTPETLSRAFAALRRYGVQVHGSTITLGDPEALRGYCHPDRLIDEMEHDLRVLVDEGNAGPP